MSIVLMRGACRTQQVFDARRVKGEGMFLKKINGPRVVALPDGRIISRADLPDANPQRWVARRKRAVAEAVQSGLISRTDAKRTYALSDIELDAWCCAYPIRFAECASSREHCAI